MGRSNYANNLYRRCTTDNRHNFPALRELSTHLETLK